MKRENIKRKQLPLKKPPLLNDSPIREYPMHNESQARMSHLNLVLDHSEGRIDNATYERALKRLLKRWPVLRKKRSGKKTTAKTPPIKLAFPHVVDPKAGVGEAALYGEGFVNLTSKKRGELTVKQLIAGGRAAYDAWVREAGFAKDARILPYDRLKSYSHPRWERIARDVFNAMEAAK